MRWPLFLNLQGYLWSMILQGLPLQAVKILPGIISICGSGTNAAWYDGKRVKPNNYGLGYILADEGSGNWLGKQLLRAFMNETLPGKYS